MKAKNKTAVTVTIVLGVIVLVAGGIKIRNRLLENFYIDQLKTGESEKIAAAFDWLGKHGSERAFLALGEFSITRYFPAFLLMRDEGIGNDTVTEYAMSDCVKKYMAAQKPLKDEKSSEKESFSAACDALRERIDMKDIGLLAFKRLDEEGLNPRNKVYLARGIITSSKRYPLSQEIRNRAMAALMESLPAEDPLCRAGAAYGLASCGKEAMDSVQALNMALSDKEEIVREAAAYALRKISGSTP